MVARYNKTCRSKARCLIRTPLAALALIAMAVPTVRAADKGQLDADAALFTVMAAINAAGYDAELDSPANHPLRKAVRDYLKTRNPPVISELKLFYASHKLPDPAANLGQYVSYALSIDGPPDFGFRYTQTELAPGVGALSDLAPLLVRFYKEANIEEVWQKSQPAFEQVIARLPGARFASSDAGERVPAESYQRIPGPPLSDLHRFAGRAQPGPHPQL